MIKNKQIARWLETDVRHLFEDPEFEKTIFDEVYCELNESLLTKTYRFKFLAFLNTILSSTRVPAYVIASYIKKLARLSLIAKPKILICILKLVGNLLLRHPILIILRDRVDEYARQIESKSPTCTLRDWLENDPFDPNHTTNLKNTRAMESFIWELMPLRFHEHPRIAKTASYLNQTNGIEIEFSIDEFIK